MHEEEFDEEWEQALFKIVWVKGWQKKRLVEASKTLSLIKDKVLTVVASEEKREKLLKESLRMTAVTSVVSTDDTLVNLAGGEEEEGDSLINRIGFWREFRSCLKGTGNCFDGITIRPTYSQDYLGANCEKLLPYKIKFLAFSTTSTILQVESSGGDLQENFELFSWFKNYRDKMKESTGIHPKFKTSPEKATQRIAFSAPKDIPLRIKLMEDENSQIRHQVFNWFSDNVGKIEAILQRAVIDFENRLPHDQGDYTVKVATSEGRNINEGSGESS